jgi:hypothetical protein
MTDVYDFVEEAEPVKKVESHKEILAAMAQQTTECAYFIRECATNTGFCVSSFMYQISTLNAIQGKRAFKEMFSDTHSQIKQYEEKFAELKSKFQLHADLQTEITVLRILDIVKTFSEYSQMHGVYLPLIHIF